MRTIRYTMMNPTGNLTCLVTESVTEMERSRVTAALMGRCEQVGYLYPAKRTGIRAGLQMMGGEFCGNAAMAAAAWTCREDGMLPGHEAALLLEVSGAAEPVPCRIRMLEENVWEGTVGMPKVLDISEAEFEGESLVRVRMEGILHLIREGAVLPRNRAESLLNRAMEKWPCPAMGLLQWDRERQYMTPLVLVKESGTMVWETGCGSGSTAVGAWTALQKGGGVSDTAVNQPGGCIRVKTTVRDDQVEEICISGRVTLEEEGLLQF